MAEGDLPIAAVHIRSIGWGDLPSAFPYVGGPSLIDQVFFVDARGLRLRYLACTTYSFHACVT